MLQEWKESVTAPICKCTVLIIKEYHCHLLHSKIVFDILLEFTGDNQCDLFLTKNYWLATLHLSDIAEEMRVQCKTSAIYIFQESL
jgi:hypothetical protein